MRDYENTPPDWIMIFILTGFVTCGVPMPGFLGKSPVAWLFLSLTTLFCTLILFYVGWNIMAYISIAVAVFQWFVGYAICSINDDERQYIKKTIEEDDIVPLT
jgi:hypothetical protein